MKRHKLLFVDDEENILKSLTRLFRGEDYEIFSVDSGYEGINLLKQHDISLILSDYRMPELNGVEFLKKAKEESPDTVRMILTGFADVEVVISAINEGEVYKFIEKPWESENLKIQIKRALEHFELLQDRKELSVKITKQNEELKDLNENLEKKVEEKTREIRRAYKEKVLLSKQLKEKVEELNGKDIILQHLLSIHSLEETLNVALNVINDVLNIEKALIYLKDYKDDFLEVKSGIGLSEDKAITGIKDLQKTGKIDLSDEETDIIRVFKTGKLVKSNENNHLIVPIQKDRKPLGVLDIFSKDEINQSFIDKLNGFISLTAIAINDSIVNENLPELTDKIEEILGEI